jgi:NifU-like protein involved in Fe-S cluster formation
MYSKKRYFSAKVTSLINEPLNIGTLKDPDGCAEVKGECGTTMMIFLKVSKGVITIAKFITDGCGVSYACGSAITEMVKEKTCEQALKITSQNIVKYLGGLPASDLHCADLSIQALWTAISDYTEKSK